MDERHDDFYERFMEQRFQKIKNPGQSSMEDSLPFPVEPLRAAPVKHPQKRVSNTSSDSGVNSPHNLSPAMPVTPDNSQSYLIPSTSRMNPPSGPLPPIQQFIKKSRKSKAKEPKYNGSQADHPDSQSVLRTRTTQGYKLQFLIFYMVLLWHSDFQLKSFILRFPFSTLFQINMPKCHKIYPNCIWHVPTEWHTLGFYSALLRFIGIMPLIL